MFPYNPRWDDPEDSERKEPIQVGNAFGLLITIVVVSFVIAFGITILWAIVRLVEHFTS